PPLDLQRGSPDRHRGLHRHRPGHRRAPLDRDSAGHPRGAGNPLRAGIRVTSSLRAMTDMHLFDRSAILPEEIDNLGHLNVRYYLVRAYRANQELLKRVGFPREARRAAGTVLGRNEAYTRFHREQRLGASLDVLGGVLALGASTLRTFYEI